MKKLILSFLLTNIIAFTTAQTSIVTINCGSPTIGASAHATSVVITENLTLRPNYNYTLKYEDYINFIVNLPNGKSFNVSSGEGNIGGISLNNLCSTGRIVQQIIISKTNSQVSVNGNNGVNKTYEKTVNLPLSVFSLWEDYTAPMTTNTTVTVTVKINVSFAFEDYRNIPNAITSFDQAVITEKTCNNIKFTKKDPYNFYSKYLWYEGNTKEDENLEWTHDISNKLNQEITFGIQEDPEAYYGYSKSQIFTKKITAPTPTLPNPKIKITSNTTNTTYFLNDGVRFFDLTEDENFSLKIDENINYSSKVKIIWEKRDKGSNDWQQISYMLWSNGGNILNHVADVNIDAIRYILIYEHNENDWNCAVSTRQSQQLNLNVLKKPMLVITPTTATELCVGEKLIIEAPTKQNVTHILGWYKDDIKINENENITINPIDWTLTVNNVGEEEEGNYYFKGYNTYIYNENESNEVTINIHSIPIKPKLYGAIYPLTEGINEKQYMDTVHVIDSYHTKIFINNANAEEKEYVWKKENEDFITTTENYIHIYPFNTNNEGNYSVFKVSEANKCTSEVTNIYLNFVPNIKNIILNAPDEITIEPKEERVIKDIEPYNVNHRNKITYQFIDYNDNSIFATGDSLILTPELILTRPMIKIKAISDDEDTFKEKLLKINLSKLEIENIDIEISKNGENIEYNDRIEVVQGTELTFILIGDESIDGIMNNSNISWYVESLKTPSVQDTGMINLIYPFNNAGNYIVRAGINGNMFNTDIDETSPSVIINVTPATLSNLKVIALLDDEEIEENIEIKRGTEISFILQYNETNQIIKNAKITWQLEKENGWVIDDIGWTTVHHFFNSIGNFEVKAKIEGEFFNTEIIEETHPFQVNVVLPEGTIKNAELGGEDDIILYPNPFTTHLHTKIFVEKSQEILISIFKNGIFIDRQIINVVGGINNTIKINTQRVTEAGIYIIKLQNIQGLDKTIRVIKQ